jgi:hypothetical protein
MVSSVRGRGGLGKFKREADLIHAYLDHANLEAVQRASH